MNESIELLEYIYQNAQMGVFTLTTLINKINNKENKIKVVIEDQLKGYERYVKESKELLKKNKVKEKDKSVITKMSAAMGINMEVMKDNSDASIAHMLTQGVTMGIVDITSKIKNYKEDADNKILLLAKNYLKFQEDQIEGLKKYL